MPTRIGTRRATQYMRVDTYMKAILKVPSSFYWLCLGPNAIMEGVVSWFATRPILVVAWPHRNP